METPHLFFLFMMSLYSRIQTFLFFICRFLLQTYHINSADPQIAIYEQNIIFTCQFIYHELWWFQHASEKESSDSQRLRVLEMHTPHG